MWKKTATLALLLLPGASCGFSDQVAGPQQIAFEGEFMPATAGSSVTGTAVALGGGGVTTLGMDLSGLEPDMEASWVMRLGACGGTGTRVVDPALFPPFEADAEGRVVTGDDPETDDPDDPGVADPIEPPQFGFRLEEDAEYAVEIFEGESGTGNLLACADMEPTEMDVDDQRSLSPLP